MNTLEELPLVGPKSDEREGSREEEVRLADGSPLYYALLPNPDALIISKDEAQTAKSELSYITSTNPDIIRSCAGKTIEEARRVLDTVKVAA